MEYQYNNWGTASFQNIYTIQKVDASTANDLWVKKYFDGVGRVVQTQARGEPVATRTIVTTTTFSDRGLVDREYVPQDLFSTSLSGYKSTEPSWKKSTFQYDALSPTSRKLQESSSKL
ncbi:MAG: hypothetical protein HY673_12510 [Chloroflexi bacterium]|nr:hypothetical protein [Chloroflexota bacterium]